MNKEQKEEDLTNLLQEKKGLKNRKIRKLLEKNTDILSNCTLEVSVGKYDYDPTSNYPNNKGSIPIYFKGKEDYQNFEVRLFASIGNNKPATLILELNSDSKVKRNYYLPSSFDVNPGYMEKEIEGSKLDDKILERIFNNICKKYVEKNSYEMYILNKDDVNNGLTFEKNKLYFNSSRIYGAYTDSRRIIYAIKQVGNILSDYITTIIDKKEIIADISGKISDISHEGFERRDLIREEEKLKLKKLNEKIVEIKEKAKKENSELRDWKDIEMYKIKKEISAKFKYCTNEMK